MTSTTLELCRLTAAEPNQAIVVQVLRCLCVNASEPLWCHQRHQRLHKCVLSTRRSRAVSNLLCNCHLLSALLCRCRRRQCQRTGPPVTTSTDYFAQKKILCACTRTQSMSCVWVCLCLTFICVTFVHHDEFPLFFVLFCGFYIVSLYWTCRVATVAC